MTERMHASDAANFQRVPYSGVLVVASAIWPATQYFIEELIKAGVHPALLAPARHPAYALPGLYPCPSLPLIVTPTSLERRLRELSITLLVPADDSVTDVLHQVYNHTKDSALRALIARSLGNPDYYGYLFARPKINQLVAQVGLDVPETVALARSEDLDAALKRVGTPAYLKIDGSWGGMGTARVDTPVRAREAWGRLLAAFGRLRAVVRFVRYGEVAMLARAMARRPNRFSLQRNVEGALITLSASCWQGRILASIGARVTQQRYDLGPACEIEVLHDPALITQAQAVVERLGFSGFCGFDFILDAAGTYHFIEFNPRVTTLCRMISASGGDQIHALFQAALGLGLSRSPSHEDGAILAL